MTDSRGNGRSDCAAHVARVKERDAEEPMEATPRLDAAVTIEDAPPSHARMLVAVMGMPGGTDDAIVWLCVE